MTETTNNNQTNHSPSKGVRKGLYFALPAFIILLVLVLEVITSRMGPLLGDMQENQTTTYVLEIVCSMLTILGAFLAIRYKQLQPVLRMLSLFCPAVQVVLVYYLFYDATQLYCLGVLGISWLMIWNVTEGK